MGVEEGDEKKDDEACQEVVGLELVFPTDF